MIAAQRPAPVVRPPRAHISHMIAADIPPRGTMRLFTW